MERRSVAHDDFVDQAPPALEASPTFDLTRRDLIALLLF
jgi:hypothetical protein